jgi:hypothetical protein
MKPAMQSSRTCEGAKVGRVSIDEDRVGGVTHIKNLGRKEQAILVNLAGPCA